MPMRLQTEACRGVGEVPIESAIRVAYRLLQLADATHVVSPTAPEGAAEASVGRTTRRRRTDKVKLRCHRPVIAAAAVPAFRSKSWGLSDKGKEEKSMEFVSWTLRRSRRRGQRLPDFRIRESHF
ncbi:hypothetical protein HPP92_008085 [Vanilla planifolia]|uniref:Uncharacterized protein n=1 Tax=Vanilla planifolia TaxID=51239 RepID=A0A835RDT7_VANPL|nr:hypothetical protein HPP92_008085 [Vanilla planifolia]